MKKTVFIKNAAILTASSLILRFAGIIFKVWLAALIGSEGIGLYQLVFSVYMLVSTFASSGISTAVTRLVAEELALGSKKGTLKILKRSIEITLIIALISLAIVYFGAEFIASNLLKDVRAASALKVLPFSLPFMGITSCLKGYFIARRKASPGAVSQLTEQAIRIFLVVFLVKAFVKKGIAVCCAAVMLGDVISELAGCLLLALTFAFDRNKLYSLSGRSRPPYKIVKKITDIALPITSGRYLNTALRTGENILVPQSLAKYKPSTDNALSQFGMIKGMALPILFFPSAVLNSVSTLLIPEMSEAAARKHTQIVKSTTEKILKLTAVIAFIFAAIFYTAGDKIGILIYKDPSVGYLLKVLSPIVPLMYLDSISDGILKGLDQQNYTFFTALSDSLLRIVLVIALLPFMGLNGFIIIMYFSNLFTCLLHITRLIKISKARLELLGEIIIPLVSALTVALLSSTLLNIFAINSNLIYIILLCAISISSYLLLLLLFGTVTFDEIKNIIK